MAWLGNYERLLCLATGGRLGVKSGTTYFLTLPSSTKVNKQLQCTQRPSGGTVMAMCTAPEQYDYSFSGHLYGTGTTNPAMAETVPRWPGELAPFHIGVAISAAGSIASRLTGSVSLPHPEAGGSFELPPTTSLHDIFLVSIGFACGPGSRLARVPTRTTTGVLASVELAQGRHLTMEMQLIRNKVVVHATASWAPAQVTNVNYIHKAMRLTRGKDERPVWVNDGCTETGATLDYSVMTCCILAAVTVANMCAQAGI